MSAKNRVLKGKSCACGRPAIRWFGNDPVCKRCADIEARAYDVRSDYIKRRLKRKHAYAPCVVEPYAVRLGTHKLISL